MHGANPLTTPFTVPPHLVELVHPDGEADDLTWDGVISIPRHACEFTTTAVAYGTPSEDEVEWSAWLILASAGYAEAVQLIDSETDEPGQHASPALILSVIRSADRCAALGGRADIRIYPLLKHLTRQPDHRNPDGTWKD